MELARRTLLLAAAAGLVLTFGTGFQSCEDSPILHPGVQFANVWLDDVLAGRDGPRRRVSGSIGVGLTTYDPGGGQCCEQPYDYHVCNPSEWMVGACATATPDHPLGYYTTAKFCSDADQGTRCGGARNDFPLGIFVNNVDPNQLYCPDGTPCAARCQGSSRPAWCLFRKWQTLVHFWARKSRSAVAEIYSLDPDVPGARVTVHFADFIANGGVYSEHIGTVLLPTPQDGGTVPITGTVSEGARFPEDQRVCVAFFQDPPYFKSTIFPAGADPLTAPRLDNGVDVQTFVFQMSGEVRTYRTAPIPGASYIVFIRDRRTGRDINFRRTFGPGASVLNVNLADQSCFGRPSCAPSSASNPLCADMPHGPNDPCTRGYPGLSGVVGLDNGRMDARFLCQGGSWYDCGWELNDPSWETKAANGQKVGGHTCDLPGRRWVPSSDPCTLGYPGISGRLGLNNGASDARFLCFAGSWYDCGWEQPYDPRWETHARHGLPVGSYVCDLSDPQHPHW